MSAIAIEGGLVHYETLGRGQPILFLHGWLGSWRYWGPSMQEMSDQYRTYALDLWGYGDSSKRAALYSIESYVKLLERFFAKLDLNQVTLIGHGLGAIVMLEYAFHHPDRINKMVAVSCPLHSDHLNQRQILQGDHSIWSKLMWWQRPSSEITALLETEKTDKAAVSASLQSFAQNDVQSNLKTIAEDEALQILFIYGERNNLVKIEPTQTFTANYPNLETIVLPEARHFPMLDETARFSRLIKDFLEIEGDLSSLRIKDEWRRRVR